MRHSQRERVCRLLILDVAYLASSFEQLRSFYSICSTCGSYSFHEGVRLSQGVDVVVDYCLAAPCANIDCFECEITLRPAENEHAGIAYRALRSITRKTVRSIELCM